MGGGGGVVDDKSESQAYELAAMFMGTEWQNQLKTNPQAADKSSENQSPSSW